MKTHRKIKYFFGFNNDLLTLKKKYKSLCFLHHPDKGGKTEIMQEINNEYNFIIENSLFDFISESEEKNYNIDYELLYPNLISQLILLNDIIVDIVGNWVWISGNTKQHKEILKELNCRFSPNKSVWYFRPENYKSSNRSAFSMDDIFNLYGRHRVVQNAPNQLNSSNFKKL